MRFARSSIAALSFAVISGCASSGSTATAAAATTGEPNFDAITEADLRRDMVAMASDAFRGREAGTLDELRASAWLADRAREAGLAPGGDDGTYFQFWPMRRTRVAATSHVVVGGRVLALWRDVNVASPVNATIDLPLVFVGA